MIAEKIHIERRVPLAVVEPVQLAVKPKQTALISRDADFWLLGGFSILAWILSLAAVKLANVNTAFDRQVAAWQYVFPALTLICNNPHFVMSYRLAYLQHPKKILSNWFSLIAVPALLVALLFFAYNVNSSTYEAPAWLLGAEARFPNVLFRQFAYTVDLGSDILRVGVWIMWALIGWHYAKQAFGVMLKYAQFNSYPLSRTQKNILRYCLLAVMPTNFICVAIESKGLSGTIHDLKMTFPSFSPWTLSFCYWFDAALVILFAGVLAQNYFRLKAVPSINFLVPFVAFYLWWMPGIWPQPYMMMMVPFFHSLQYLPFAYKRLEGEISRSKTFTIGLTFNILAIFISGYLLFDLLPTWIDERLHTLYNFGSSFFLIAALIFFNVHHFFIDSVIWRSEKK